jgi:hypothetical protein
MDRSTTFISYLYLSFLALAVAALLRSTIEYLETGKFGFSAGDPIFQALCVCSFAALALSRYFASRLLRCSVCGRFSQDTLIFDEGPSRRFCREHLIERFKQEFTAWTEKMVVVYPSLEMKKGPYVYEYRTMEAIPEKFLQGRIGRLFQRALSSIEGRCARCGRKATVAYFGPGNTPWEPITISGKQGDEPGGEIPASFQVTCPHCIADEVCFSLSRFEGVFSEGIVLPHDGSGVFISRLQ